MSTTTTTSTSRATAAIAATAAQQHSTSAATTTSTIKTTTTTTTPKKYNNKQHRTPSKSSIIIRDYSISSNSNSNSPSNLNTPKTPIKIIHSSIIAANITNISNTNNSPNNNSPGSGGVGGGGGGSFFSPIHQRLIEWEDRLRRWKLFSGGRRRNHHHQQHQSRSASSDPKPSLITTNTNNRFYNNILLIKNSTSSTSSSPKRPTHFAGSLTCPIPRKNMQLGGQQRRPQQFEPDRPAVTDEELERRYAEIKSLSGVITIGPQKYEGVKIENLLIRAQLGSGTCGVVTQRVLDNRLLAVKEMKRTDNDQETKRIFMDLQVIIKSNDCPFIVRSYGYILTYDHVYICMETMAMCLEKLYKNHLKPKGFFIPELILGKVAVSVIEALKYLKDTHGIIHRDIKPSNILIDWNGYIKLCDFGIAGQLIDSLASTSSLGCTAYLSPERIQRTRYDVRADVWSLGITLIELAVCEYPYNFESPFDLMCSITDKPAPRLPETFSYEFRLFVEQCLTKDTQSRPKYDMLIVLPWFQIHRNNNVDVGEWLSSVLTVEDDDE